jgi:dolichyl-phosphate beta-glucosyltransferase
MYKDILISIIIPAYNEGHRIASTLSKIHEYFKDKKFKYEVIVVDDGSIDNTVRIVEENSKLFENIVLIENGENMGKGYSVREGMIEASGDLRLFMDADSSVDIKTLDLFVKYIKTGADIIIGSIEVGGSSNIDENHWYRRTLGKISKTLIRLIATPGIYDTQRGFKLFTRDASKIVFDRQTIDRWGFDIEIIVIALQHNLNIKELPVTWINSRTSSVHLGSYFATLFELFKILYQSLMGKYK